MSSRRKNDRTVERLVAITSDRRRSLKALLPTKLIGAILVRPPSLIVEDHVHAVLAEIHRPGVVTVASSRPMRRIGGADRLGVGLELVGRERAARLQLHRGGELRRP